MNERLQELADQAGFQSIVRGDHIVFDISTKENLKEFAELIVQECLEVVKWTPSLYSNDEYVKNIKTHFGVE